MGKINIQMYSFLDGRHDDCRENLRLAAEMGFDGVELANIGDSSRIEHIANDVYLLWNTAKINEDDLVDGNGDPKPRHKLKRRTRRVIKEPGEVWPHSLYIENMKARDYEGGAYCLVDFNGATGRLAPRTFVK